MGRKPVLTKIPERVQSDFNSNLDEVDFDRGDTAVHFPDDSDEWTSTEDGSSDSEVPRADVQETLIPTQDYEIVFEVLGQEIIHQAGSFVGSEIRQAIVNAGRSEEDALYVHRNHAYIKQKDGEILLERVGENSLEVNGELVERVNS